MASEAVMRVQPRNFSGNTNRKALACSYYLIQNINYFGSQGGFQAIHDRLANYAMPLSMANFARLLAPLCEVRGVLDGDFLLSYVPSLQEGDCALCVSLMCSCLLTRFLCCSGVPASAAVQ